MNPNSHLCRYLAEHSDWQTRLAEEYGLTIRQNGPYAIFIYGIAHGFADPIIQEARGIILDVERLEVVCWPFRKFGNYNESYADRIDWTTAVVQEKVDGSIIKLWYDRRGERWVFSTNGTLYASDAHILGSCGQRSYLDVLESAENYTDIPFSTLDRDKTYIFELVSPENRVIVPYEKAMLYHLGTRHNITGVETEEDIGIRKPVRYPLHTLADCVRAAEHLNDSAAGVEHEGFVVVDAHWNRVKIKDPAYLVRHKIKTISLSPDHALDLLLNSGYDILQLCKLRPRAARVLKYYDWQLEEVFAQADQTAELARAMYEEYSHERKAVAEALRGNRLAPIGFEALRSDKGGRELLGGKRLNHIVGLVKPYEQLSST